MNFNKMILRPIPPVPVSDIPAVSSVYQPPMWTGAKGYYTNVRNYLYLAETDGGLLVVTAYWDGKFAWRTFIEDTDYCTQLTIDSPKKSTAGVSFLTAYSQTYIPLNGADKVISEYIRTNHIYSLPPVWGKWDEGMKKVEALQKRIKDNRTKERHRRIKESIAECMLEIKEPTKAFYKWALKQSDDIFVIYKTGENHGVCTHCCKQVEKGNKWKHRERITCPHCHKKAELLCSGRFRDGRIEKHCENLWYTQKTSEGCCVRLFNAYYFLCKNTGYELNPDFKVQVSPEWVIDIDIFEKGRFFLDDKGVIKNSFEWGDFMQTHVSDWCRGPSGYCRAEGKVFTGNYKQALSHYECLKYMPWNKVAQVLNRYTPVFVIKQAIERPWVEYLLKMKLTHLAAHYLNSYCNEVAASEWLNPEIRKPQSLAHILGINRAQLNAIVPYNPTYTEFKLYKYLLDKKAGMAEWLQLKDYANYSADMIAAMEYQPVNRYIRYINEQASVFERHGAGGIQAVISDYGDYIRDAVAAEYNMEDTATINPRDLCMAHSEAEIDERLKSYERNYSHYAEALAVKAAEVTKIKNIKFNGKDYSIAPIMSWEELFEESKYLRHCVASYADRYSDGRCIIIAVRRTSHPQEPFVTVELSGDLKYIRQARGYKNHAPSEQVKEAIENWHKQLVAKNTKKAG